MNLLERVLTLLRVNLNSMVERADDPEKVLRQLQIDMRNQLMQVKTQVATAISEGRSYNEIIRQVQRYQQQQQEQEQLVSTMKGVLQQLEAKISEVETTIELLATRKRNALLQQRVFDALKKSDEMKDSGQAERAYDAVMETEARAHAMADLHQRNLDVQLEQLSQEQLVEQQLNTLKAKKRSVIETPLLHEGNPHQSPLIPSQPQNNTPARKRPETKSEEHEPSASQSGTKELDITQLKKLMEQ